MGGEGTACDARAKPAWSGDAGRQSNQVHKTTPHHMETHFVPLTRMLRQSLVDGTMGGCGGLQGWQAQRCSTSQVKDARKDTVQRGGTPSCPPCHAVQGRGGRG